MDFGFFSWNHTDAKLIMHAIFRHRFYALALADKVEFRILLERVSVFWETALIDTGISIPRTIDPIELPFTKFGVRNIRQKNSAGQ